MSRNVLVRMLLFVWPAIIPAQTALRLSLKEALELATSPRSIASIELAQNAEELAKARLAQARALLKPNFEGAFAEQNITRNLGAEGFNFPTGVPNFTIPQEVGPYSTYDVRLLLNQNLFDLSAMRRMRGLKSEIEATHAEIAVSRDRSATLAAHDYMTALRAAATIEATRAAIALSETLLRRAQDRVEGGTGTAVELTRAKLRLATDQRKLSIAEGEQVQANLQLLGDLGLDLNVPLELTDRLVFVRPSDAAASESLAQALRSRAELQVSQFRENEARNTDDAIRLERLPSISLYGDVGPLSSVLTHLVGVSVKIPLFDGGRREARRMEAIATVHRYEIERRDLQRQIALQVRRAEARLQAAAIGVDQCDAALLLAEQEVAETRRRFEGGVTGNIEVVEAQAKLAQARDDRIAMVFTWNQARVDLAQATGTITSLSIPLP